MYNCVFDETGLFCEKGTILSNVTDKRVIWPVSGVLGVGKPQNDSAS